MIAPRLKRLKSDMFSLAGSVITAAVLSGTEVVPEVTCIAYGPGLDSATLSLPVHYFFVRMIGPDGLNLTKSLGQFGLFVQLKGVPKACLVRPEVIDRYDGTYIVRYKKFCLSLNEHATHFFTLNSDTHFEGPIVPSECACPMKMDQWLLKAQCPSEFSNQILKHTAIWPVGSVDLLSVLEQAQRKWGLHEESFSFCHYKIRSPKVVFSCWVYLYRRCYGKHVGFKMFADEIFSFLVKKIQLPDIDLFINLGDWPLEKLVRGADSSRYVPMLSWCRSNDTVDIVLPTYELVEAVIEMMGRLVLFINNLCTVRRHSLELLSVQGMRNVSWSNKFTKAFWRGRDSTSARLLLVNISRLNPDILDARITKFFFFREQMDYYGPEAPIVTFQKFFDSRLSFH
ncbi:unnamed protein product [Soboliphyme baturini]|uniref:CAP10 domain-containing protein n=1 Tax=Soboliphyme baturini TaxID=241478 RepID=A0A183IAX0_9BILA|nr:unnamed protein product [Soboliphyme baturini]